jgi:protein O-mannosyl-transferase
MDNLKTSAYTTFGKTYIHLLLIITIGLSIYSHTLLYPFVFDDYPNIVNNPAIRIIDSFRTTDQLDPLMPSNARNLFKSRYVGFLSFALNYRLHGLEVFGYHLVNISIHLGNALLVYWLIILIFNAFSSDAKLQTSSPTRDKAKYLALIIALLFVSHPVQTQAVTYIVQRFSSLAAMFYLTAMATYIRFRLAKNAFSQWTSYAIAFLSACLAMLTKEISITLPILMCICEFFFLSGPLKKRFVYLLPFLCTLIIIPLLILSSMNSATDLVQIDESVQRFANVEAISRTTYLFTEFRVILTYLRLLIAPANQNLDYDYSLSHSLFSPEVFFSFLLLLFLIGVSIYLYYRSRISGAYAWGFRLISFGILWFFVTLSVESSLIPIGDVIFEHRLYLPSIGIFLASVVSINYLGHIVSDNSKHMRKLMVFFFMVFLCFLCMATYARNVVWSDSLSLWRDTAIKSPNKGRVLLNLGIAYAENRKFPDALKHLRSVANQGPKYNSSDTLMKAHRNIGLILLRQKEYAAAADEFLKWLEFNYYDASAHFSLGEAYFYQNKLEEALKCFRNALVLDSSHSRIRYYLAKTLEKMGRLDEAIVEYKTNAKLHPYIFEVHFELGSTLEKLGRSAEAFQSYLVAMSLNPNFPSTLTAEGVKDFNGGNYLEAARKFNIVIALDKTNTVAHYSLALAYINLYRFSDAEKALISTIKLDPDFAEAHYQLAIVHQMLGKPRLSLKELKEVLILRPDHRAAQEAYKRLGKKNSR